MERVLNKPNGLTVKILAGIVTTIFSGVIFFMGTAIDANDKINVAEHTAIREEATGKVETLRTELKQDIRDIKADQQVMLVQQTRMLTILEGM